MDWADTFLGKKADTSNAKIRIMQCRKTHVYYAESTEDCLLTYYISSKPKTFEAAMKAEPNEMGGRIQKTVAWHKNQETPPLDGYNQKHMKSISSKQHQWLLSLFTFKNDTDRNASCRIRCLSIRYQIIARYPEYTDLIRMVRIDNCHVRLEVNMQGRWLQLDVGGTSSDEVYQKKSTIKNQKAAQFQAVPMPRLTTNLGQQSAEIIPQYQAMMRRHKAPRVYGYVNSAKVLYSHCVDQDGIKRTLVVTPEPKRYAEGLLQEAREKKVDVFYLYHPKQLEKQDCYLVLADSDEPKLSQESAFEAFLKKNQDKPSAIVVNWAGFTVKQRLQMNTVLDAEGAMLNGHAIPEKMRVVSICTQESEDPSFESRHQLLIKGSFYRAADSKHDKTLEIDLQGCNHWRQKLFGKVHNHNNQLSWVADGHLSQTIAEGTRVNLVNVPKHAKKAIQDYLDASVAKGFLNYQGYVFPLLPGVTFSILDKPFDFSQFDSVKINIDITQASAPDSAVLVNDYLFDMLLYGKHVDNDSMRYQECDGVIKAHQGKELSLWITSELSDAQWYSMLLEVKRHEVQLTLCLAPQVSLPLELGLKISEIPQQEQKSTEQEVKKKNIVVSQHAFKSLRDLRESGEIKKKASIVYVEDENYQSLIERVEFKRTDNGFEHFNSILSDVIVELTQGDDVVLVGQFSDDLLKMLQPLLIHPEYIDINGERCEFKGRLSFIIEDKALNPSGAYARLNFLSPKQYSIIPADDVVDKPFVVEEVRPSNGIDVKPDKKAANAFMKGRIETLETLLASKRIVVLKGPTGVGKSSLVRQLEPAVFWGEDDMLEWLVKGGALFFDEMNIVNEHFARLRALLVGDQLFYKGKFYTIRDDHRLICACNDKSYGGGRVEQALFSDYPEDAVAEFYLKDFSVDYIYFNLLKPIFDALPQDLDWPESEFQDFCATCINHYYVNRNNAADWPDERIFKGVTGFVSNNCKSSIIGSM